MKNSRGLAPEARNTPAEIAASYYGAGSHVEWFEGNFQDYEADKMRRLGTDSTIPHRIKYKKFSR